MHATTAGTPAARTAPSGLAGRRRVVVVRLLLTAGLTLALWALLGLFSDSADAVEGDPDGAVATASMPESFGPMTSEADGAAQVEDPPPGPPDAHGADGPSSEPAGAPPSTDQPVAGHDEPIEGADGSPDAPGDLDQGVGDGDESPMGPE
jgi:hypothetical protein